MRGNHQLLSFSHLHHFFSGLVLVFLLNSCSQLEPKFTRDYFPERYQYNPQSSTKNKVKVRLLNGNLQINRQVVKFWFTNIYKNIYRQLHPFIQISRKDLRDLSVFLNQTSKIYYISWPPEKKISRAQVRGVLSCTPLSNIEIQFLFHSIGNQPFSSNGLALLFISSHELLQQSGAAPLYPQILSVRLRKEKKLKPLKTIENFNLFAKKDAISERETLSPGIVICRRDDQHSIKISMKR